MNDTTPAEPGRHEARFARLGPSQRSSASVAAARAAAFSSSGRACPLGLGGARLGQIGALPGELRLGAAEVTVGRSLLVDGSHQIEHLAQTIGCQVEMLADELRQALARQAAGAESLHHD